MPKVLIADKLAPAAVDIFHNRGLETETAIGLSKDELIAKIPEFDGLVVRSACKPDADVIAAADNLKVIGRAGIGVDNIDIKAATGKGVVVMNTPFGNAVTTAEHAIAMMFAAARQIPAANAGTQAGDWPKKAFMGTELSYKTLGMIGCGNIGARVAERAKGLQMKVLAYDPFLTEERAIELGVEKAADLDAMLARADAITLHTPLTDQTRNILSAEALAKTKKGVILVNCARGGLVDEAAVAEGLKSGHIGAAAFDVFAEEPAKENVLFGAPNFIATPHLGAATTEAQENVALQVAEQMSDYLLTGAVTNALNMPSVTAEEARVMGPWLKLAEHLGSFVGQLTEDAIETIEITYNGVVKDMNLKALNCGAIAGVMKATNPDVNMVSAPIIAKERGIELSTVTQDKSGVFDGYIRLNVKSASKERSIAGTVFSDGKPRFIQIKGINIDAEIGEHMLYTTNEDVPGIIGTLGRTMGEMNVNIANFTLGRASKGHQAIAMLYLDEQPPAAAVNALKATGLFQQVRPLRFSAH